MERSARTKAETPTTRQAVDQFNYLSSKLPKTPLALPVRSITVFVLGRRAV